MQISYFNVKAIWIALFSLIPSIFLAQLSVSITNTHPSICTGGNSVLTAVPSIPGGTFLWSPGNLTTQSITVSPSSTVTYTLTYTLFGSNASANTTVTVNISPTLFVSTNVPNNTICTGQSICLTASSGINGCQYQWSTGQQNATYCASPVNSTVYSVTCIAPNGCTTSQSTPVTVNLAPIIQTNDYAICAGSSVAISASVFPQGGVFAWSTGQGQSSIQVSPPTTHVYQVSYSVNGCAPVTDSVVVTVNTVPIISVLDYNVCLGNSVLLTAQVSLPGGSYQWSNGATSAQQTITPQSSSIMWLHYQMPSGCNAVDSFQIQVVPIPTATISNNGTTLIASPNAAGYSYQWLNCITQQNMPGQTTSSFPLINGTFAVIISVAQSQCRDTSDCLLINNVGYTEAFTQETILYPNPCNDFVDVHGVPGDILWLLNSHGELHLSKVMKEDSLRIDVSELPAGIYFVRKNIEIYKLVKL
ncbi:MAG: T9SS C-terminal target domain-containing protein [Flavobacteriia bacterium]|nr:T9SS C-terminal target domain-containing protein [Flavobacteriia bacterium]